MTFLTTPLPVGSRPSATYQNLNVNATSENTQYGFDHVALDAGANNGMHKKITFPSGIVAPTVTGTQIAIYPNTSSGLSIATASGTVGLFNILSTTVGSAPYQLQRMVTPFGLIFYYGIVTANSSGFTFNYTSGSEVSQTVNLQRVGGQDGSTQQISSAGTGSCSFGGLTSGFSYSLWIVTRIP